MDAAPLAESAVDVGGSEHVSDGSGRDQRGVEQHRVRERPPREFEVVHGGEHRAALRLPSAQDMGQLLGAEEIEPGERFIEEEDIGTLREGAGEDGASHPTVVAFWSALRGMSAPVGLCGVLM